MINWKIVIPYSETEIDSDKAWIINLYGTDLDFRATGGGSLPAWITWGSGILNFNPTSTGIFYIDFTIDGGTTWEVMTITVLSSLTEPVINCIDDNNINILWRTREGGIASFNFDQRKNYSFDSGKANTFDNNNIVKYFDKGKSFDRVNVYKTGIDEDTIKYLKSLRQSIQAWIHEYKPLTTNGTSVDVLTPILVDSDSFDLFNTKDSFYEIQLSFSYANVLKNILQ